MQQIRQAITFKMLTKNRNARWWFTAQYIGIRGGTPVLRRDQGGKFG